MSKTTKCRIYVSHRENETYFNSKLPTYREAFCYITRSVKPVTDESGCYEELAHFTTPSGVTVEVNMETGEIVGAVQ